MQKSIWPLIFGYLSPHSPFPRHPGDPHTSPSRLAPSHAGLGSKLILGDRGSGRALRTLCGDPPPPLGLCARRRTWQSRRPPKPLSPPSQPQPLSRSALAPGLTAVSAAAADALALSMSKRRPGAGGLGGRAAAPASPALKLCARPKQSPKQSPFPASPSPSPPRCRGARGRRGARSPYLPCPGVGNLLPTAVIGPGRFGECLCCGTGRSSPGRSPALLCSERWDFGARKAVADPPPSRPSPPPALPSWPAGMCGRHSPVPTASTNSSSSPRSWGHPDLPDAQHREQETPAQGSGGGDRGVGGCPSATGVIGEEGWAREGLAR